MPKVSIVVPVYQMEKYLRKCLNCLVMQTLQDIEIIIVNDGSTDGSQNIIDEFQKKFPTLIKSFYKKNGGLSDARNYGLDHAKGCFIAFVDSDDYVSALMFEEMFQLAEKHNAQMVICNLKKVDEEGNVTEKLTQIPNMEERVELRSNLSIFSDLSYFACNKIFKKELFDHKRFKVGVHFEDIQLIPQLLLDCKTISQTQSYHYNYLEREGSITKTHNLKGLDILNAVDEVSEKFHLSEFKDEHKYLKNFQILEGVYTFIAYQAFVKNQQDYLLMSNELRLMKKKYGITLWNIINYQRFDKNYLLSLPLKKNFYYLLYFIGADQLLRKIL